MDTNKAVYLRGLDHVMRMNGLSCTEVAKLMNRSIGYKLNVSNWRTCRNKATIESMRNVAKAINCDPMQLVAVPDIAQQLRDLTYTVHSYLQEVVALKVAIAQLDSK